MEGERRYTPEQPDEKLAEIKSEHARFLEIEQEIKELETQRQGITLRWGEELGKLRYAHEIIGEELGKEEEWDVDRIDKLFEQAETARQQADALIATYRAEARIIGLQERYGKEKGAELLDSETLEKKFGNTVEQVLQEYEQNGQSMEGVGLESLDGLREALGLSEDDFSKQLGDLLEHGHTAAAHDMYQAEQATKRAGESKKSKWDKAVDYLKVGSTRMSISMATTVGVGKIAALGAGALGATAGVAYGAVVAAPLAALMVGRWRWRSWKNNQKVREYDRSITQGLATEPDKRTEEQKTLAEQYKRNVLDGIRAQKAEQLETKETGKKQESWENIRTQYIQGQIKDRAGLRAAFEKRRKEYQAQLEKSVSGKNAKPEDAERLMAQEAEVLAAIQTLYMTEASLDVEREVHQAKEKTKKLGEKGKIKDVLNQGNMRAITIYTGYGVAARAFHHYASDNVKAAAYGLAGAYLGYKATSSQLKERGMMEHGGDKKKMARLALLIGTGVLAGAGAGVGAAYLGSEVREKIETFLVNKDALSGPMEVLKGSQVKSWDQLKTYLTSTSGGRLPDERQADVPWPKGSQAEFNRIIQELEQAGKKDVVEAVRKDPYFGPRIGMSEITETAPLEGPFKASHVEDKITGTPDAGLFRSPENAASGITTSTEAAPEALEAAEITGQERIAAAAKYFGFTEDENGVLRLDMAEAAKEDANLGKLEQILDRLVAAQYVEEFASDGKLGDEEAAKIINMAANLRMAFEQGNAEFMDKWTPEGSAKLSALFNDSIEYDAETQTLTIKDQAKFEQLVDGLRAHADELGAAGKLDGAVGELPSIKQETWRDIVNAGQKKNIEVEDYSQNKGVKAAYEANQAKEAPLAAVEPAEAEVEATPSLAEAITPVEARTQAQRELPRLLDEIKGINQRTTDPREKAMVGLWEKVFEYSNITDHAKGRAFAEKYFHQLAPLADEYQDVRDMYTAGLEQMLDNEIRRGEGVFHMGSANSEKLADFSGKLGRMHGLDEQSSEIFVSWLSGEDAVLDRNDFKRLGLWVSEDGAVKKNHFDARVFSAKVQEFMGLAGSTELPQSGEWEPRTIHYIDDNGVRHEDVVNMRAITNAQGARAYELDTTGDKQVDRDDHTGEFYRYPEGYVQKSDRGIEVLEEPAEKAFDAQSAGSESAVEQAPAQIPETQEPSSSQQPEPARVSDVEQVAEAGFEDMDNTNDAIETFKNLAIPYEQKMAALKGVMADGERLKFEAFDLARSGDRIMVVTGEEGGKLRAYALTKDNIGRFFESYYNAQGKALDALQAEVERVKPEETPVPEAAPEAPEAVINNEALDSFLQENLDSDGAFEKIWGLDSVDQRAEALALLSEDDLQEYKRYRIQEVAKELAGNPTDASLKEKLQAGLGEYGDALNESERESLERLVGQK